MALTDMVIMPGADYQDACDAIREKTGGTDAIKSGDMGAAIRGISGGVSVKTGRITLSSDSTVITIPDVGTECNRVSIVRNTAGALDAAQLNNNPMWVYMSNASTGSSMSDENMLILSMSESGPLAVMSQGVVIDNVFSFNADGSVTIDIGSLGFGFFAAGNYRWTAWAE